MNPQRKLSTSIRKQCVQIVFSIDQDAWDAHQEYVNQSVELRNGVRAEQAKAVEVFSTDDVIGDVQTGKGQRYAEMCGELGDAKEAVHRHVTSSLEVRCAKSISFHRVCSEMRVCCVFGAAARDVLVHNVWVLDVCVCACKCACRSTLCVIEAGNRR
jgi:hypothetical protein